MKVNYEVAFNTLVSSVEEIWQNALVHGGRLPVNISWRDIVKVAKEGAIRT